MAKRPHIFPTLTAAERLSKRGDQDGYVALDPKEDKLYRWSEADGKWNQVNKIPVPAPVPVPLPSINTKFRVLSNLTTKPVDISAWVKGDTVLSAADHTFYEWDGAKWVPKYTISSTPAAPPAPPITIPVGYFGAGGAGNADLMAALGAGALTVAELVQVRNMLGANLHTLTPANVADLQDLLTVNGIHSNRADLLKLVGVGIGGVVDISPFTAQLAALAAIQPDLTLINGYKGDLDILHPHAAALNTLITGVDTIYAKRVDLLKLVGVGGTDISLRTGQIDLLAAIQVELNDLITGNLHTLTSAGFLGNLDGAVTQLNALLALIDGAPGGAAATVQANAARTTFELTPVVGLP
jgi:hypothetical protein